jgi:hypothetical protein
MIPYPKKSLQKMNNFSKEVRNISNLGLKC